MRLKFKTLDSAERVLHQFMFDEMDEAEKEKFAAHCRKFGTTPDEFIKTWAGESVKSVENGWEGFKPCAMALNGDWGFTFPLDAEHARGKVLIKVAGNDELGLGWVNTWLRITPTQSLLLERAVIFLVSIPSMKTSPTSSLKSLSFSSSVI